MALNYLEDNCSEEDFYEEYDGIWDDLDVPVIPNDETQGVRYNPNNINDWDERMGAAGFDTPRGFSLIENPISTSRFEDAH